MSFFKVSADQSAISTTSADQSEISETVTSVSVNGSGYELRTKKNPSPCTERKPKFWVFVGDISGSMGGAARKNNTAETDGYDRMTLLRMSLMACVNFLEGDRIMIVQFDDVANVILDETIGANKENATTAIKSMKPRNGTRIWQGLECAFNEIKKEDLSRTEVIMALLTDGETDDDPVTSMATFLERPENSLLKNIKLTTFGYSSSANSALLSRLGSVYMFIPDSSMIATAVCSWMANMIGSESYEHEYTVTPYGFLNLRRAQNISTLTPNQQYEVVRHHMCEKLGSICADGKVDVTPEMRAMFEEIVTLIKSIAQSPLRDELLKDFESTTEGEEQIRKALSNNAWYKEWGYSYIMSYRSAHQARVCHNFKDRGVQLYATEYIRELQDQAYDVYSKLPAPPPVLRALPTQTYVQQTDMSGYTNRSGGCWDPQCKVMLADGTMKKLCDLDGSELLYYDENTSSRIKYVVRLVIQRSDQMVSVCDVGGLVITPWHPIVRNGKWVFPNEVSQPYLKKLDYVMNIVLEDTGHEFVVIEGTKTVTLAHNVQQFNGTNRILDHAYYGTNTVLTDLEQFATGGKIITVDKHEIVRDNSTMLVCRIRKV